jgi:dihydroorotate dehydrogenase (NAD+) catalytic subunit
MTYRMDRTYRWNYEHGPQLVDDALPPVPETSLKPFFGRRVRSRLGISAGLLLNSRWIAAYARLGYDLLTYKTVRSTARACYPLPNWVFVDAREPLAPGEDGPPLCRLTHPPPSASRLTTAVCFGMPSMPPDVWRADVREARRLLRPDQSLMVSVVGTPPSGVASPSRRHSLTSSASQALAAELLAQDFARCARWAAEAGADAVEANFSCPNVCSAEGMVYRDPAMSRQIAECIRAAIPATPFLVKAGYFAEEPAMEAFLRAVEPSADGVVLVNAVSRRVVDPDGTPTFGAAMPRVGILGGAIHDVCVANVHRAVTMRDRLGLRLHILAVGGVFTGDDAAHYFAAGAEAVLMGGAPMFYPELAIRMKRCHPDW